LVALLRTISGEIILVGHSYGGALITNAAGLVDEVKALVYVSAVAPDEGESLEDLVRRFAGAGLAEQVLSSLTLGQGRSQLFLRPDHFRPGAASRRRATSSWVSTLPFRQENPAAHTRQADHLPRERVSTTTQIGHRRMTKWRVVQSAELSKRAGAGPHR
jgi:pimeloyl-ACP methyl ester carboxylesterase